MDKTLPRCLLGSIRDSRRFQPVEESDSELRGDILSM
jgi:hypothetical protein